MAKPLELSEIPIGTPIRFVPTRPNVPMGPKLPAFPTGGKMMKLSAYLVGCVKRGSVRAYLASAAVPVTAPVASPVIVPDDPEEE